MFIKINKPGKGQNTGSCKKLADYLDKEKDKSFFSRDNNIVDKNDVIHNIDRNTSALGKNDKKFYMLSINPSQSELKHLIGRHVTDFSELTKQEQLRLYSSLQKYTHNVMDIYAKNFNRENVKSGDDLVYFARIETIRKYKHYEPNVLNGIKKTGDIKEGLQVHVHIIVSRKSKDGSAKLSPNGRFRGASWEKDGTQITRGFNHVNFKLQSIEKFNKQFNYKPFNKDNSTLLEKHVTGQVANRTKARLISETKKQLIGNNFTTEQKVISGGKQIVTAIVNPKAALKQQIIKAAKTMTRFVLQQGKGL